MEKNSSLCQSVWNFFFKTRWFYTLKQTVMSSKIAFFSDFSPKCNLTALLRNRIAKFLLCAWKRRRKFTCYLLELLPFILKFRWRRMSCRLLKWSVNDNFSWDTQSHIEDILKFADVISIGISLKHMSKQDKSLPVNEDKMIEIFRKK